MAPGKLALFDLDGTLLDGDTDELWCAFLIEEGVLERAGFEARNRSVVERYRAGAITPAEFCAFYASTLQGRSRGDWAALRDRFVASRVLPRIGEAARALLAAHRDAGERVLLTTATNRFLTETIAAALGFAPDELIATELEEADGIFTGANAGVLNMRDGKVARLAAWLEANGLATTAIAEATFYSDSANDLPLLHAVARAVAVDPDAVLRAEAEARGWSVVMLPR
ncbi:MAG: HAD-IB family hydrolase [Burkholderiales bacterium]|nr:HAD-IB family hydrolase [Burkholderiales bacterium]